MSDESTAWTVLRHGPMTRVSETVHRVEGDLPGIPLLRVMTVIRRPDGGVLVHSPIAVDEPTLTAVLALGPVRDVVVPSALHRLDAPAYAARFPEAKVWSPVGGRRKVAAKVRVDGTLDAFPSDAHLRVMPIDGIRQSECALVVTDADGVTLVLNDVVFDMPHLTGAHGFVFRHITASSGGPRVSRLFRVAAMADREALRRSLRELADLPGLRRVIVSHHRVIGDDPRGTLRAVADAL